MCLYFGMVTCFLVKVNASNYLNNFYNKILTTDVNIFKGGIIEVIMISISHNHWLQNRWWNESTRIKTQTQKINEQKANCSNMTVWQWQESDVVIIIALSIETSQTFTRFVYLPVCTANNWNNNNFKSLWSR